VYVCAAVSTPCLLLPGPCSPLQTPIRTRNESASAAGASAASRREAQAAPRAAGGEDADAALSCGWWRFASGLWAAAKRAQGAWAAFSARLTDMSCRIGHKNANNNEETHAAYCFASQ
jgi:hypothetical protein